jgi:hypothetical protein
VSGVGRIRVGGGARRSSVQRRSRGRPRKKDCCIGRAAMLGRERRGRGVGRRPDEVEKWPPAARVRSESGVGLLG